MGIIYFSYLCSKPQIVGTRKNCLVEAVIASTHNLWFEQTYEKYQIYFIRKISFFGGKIFNIFE